MSTTTAPETPATVTDEAPEEKPNPLTFEALAVMAFTIAFIAIIVSIFGASLAARAIDEHRATPAASSPSTAASVALDEFTVTPAPLQVPAGSSVSVRNNGTTVHDLAVEDQGLNTPELNPGEESELDLGDLAPGNYKMYCQIPGHRESGMEGVLTVG